MQINHRNGIKTDNRIENLEYITPKANTEHKFKVLGYKPVCGERSKKSRISDARVLEIRRRVLAGERGVALASEFGVDQALVSGVRHGKYRPYLYAHNGHS